MQSTIVSNPDEPEDESESSHLPDRVPVPRILYDVGDACFILGNISKQMLYRLIHLRQITPIKVGTRSMFDMEELERFVAERKAEGCNLAA